MQKASNQSSQSTQGSSAAEPPAGEWATDPVCGQEVETADSATQQARHKGKSYYFCSEECRQQFEASPEEFEGEVA